MNYRVGIIGCGSIARSHAEGYLRVANAEMVAVADPHPFARGAILRGVWHSPMPTLRWTKWWRGKLSISPVFAHGICSIPIAR